MRARRPSPKTGEPSTFRQHALLQGTCVSVPYSRTLLQQDGVPEVNPKNWPSWSFKMINRLEILDLWEYVEEEPLMLVNEDGNLTIESQELAKMVRKARSRILMRVSSRYRGFLKHCTTAKQVWDRFRV